MAAEAGVGKNWPYMVMSVVRFALAVRDADGQTLVADEVLDQIALPLKAAAGVVLQRAGLLRPRTAPPRARPTIGACEDCGSWGITGIRCRGCADWQYNSLRYPLGRCPRCGRAELPVHRQEGLCRGCVTFVRAYGNHVGRHTQLTFAGQLSHQLCRQAGVLGFSPHNQSGPAMRELARRGEDAKVLPAVSEHLLDPAQQILFTLDRDWSTVRELGAANLPSLTESAAALLAEFGTVSPVSMGGDVFGGRAVLRRLVAWLGAEAPVREGDVRALAARPSSPSARRLLHFLHQRGLLETDEPTLTDQDAGGTRNESRAVVADLDAERSNRHHEAAIAAKIAELPGPMADHIRAWVRVMRGDGRRRHPPAAYEWASFEEMYRGLGFDGLFRHTYLG